jgi:uncharacterized protein DUF6968
MWSPATLDGVGEVIATRKLVLADQESTEVLVLLGKPAQIPDYSGYYCPYQIKGAGYDKVMAMCGVDPFQALQLSLSILGVELEVVNKEFGGKLRWEHGEEGDFGFNAAIQP